IAPFALRLSAAVAQDLADLAEGLDREMREAELAIAASPAARRRLALPVSLRPLLSSRLPLPRTPTLARYVRFDFHPTPRGWQISEANSDVPGGLGEAGGLAALMLPHHPGAVHGGDPSAALAEAIARRVAPGSAVALVHATAFTDDWQVVLSVRDALAAHGVEGTTVGPDALEWSLRGDASVRIAGARPRPIAGIVRNYPTEWLPSLLGAGGWWRQLRGGRTPVANPPVLALFSQSKRFPLTWDRLGLSMPTWRAILPETRDPRDVDAATGEWVLKPALGRIGEDVGLPGVTESRGWRAIARSVRRRPSQWVAQRRFEITPVETPMGRKYPCIGVFVVDGRAAGFYGRLGRTPLIDGSALEAAVLIDRPREEGELHVERA
ncbi:MAG: glutathionylspermidine synthase family protein, partial [Myxococcales bacterium]|nr:glutathionylspermidine synthase family protein [Myxococcales bacterium]